MIAVSTYGECGIRTDTKNEKRTGIIRSLMTTQEPRPCGNAYQTT